MSDQSDSDRECQDFWHWITLLGFQDAFLPAYFGLFGENARKGAEQTAEEMGPIYGTLTVLAIVAGIVWAAGHYVFLAW